MEILCFDFEILWMSSQLIVQWNYIIYFYIWDSFFNNFLHQFLGKSAKFKRSCKSARFVYFDLWLRRYQNICTLPKYYYSIERVYFNCRLLILFISTFSFLLFLYTVSWKYKWDYLHASIDILFYIVFYIINMMKKHWTLLYCLHTYDKKVPIWICPPQYTIWASEKCKTTLRFLEKKRSVYVIAICRSR